MDNRQGRVMGSHRSAALWGRGVGGVGVATLVHTIVQKEVDAFLVWLF